MNVTPREWRFVAIASLTLLLVTSIPYVVGFWMSDADRIFGGFVYAVEDGNSYLAKMQTGAAGHWLFHLAYTPEPHLGGLFFLYYILLGKLSRFLGLSMVAGLHLSRVFSVPFGMYCYYRFIAYWTPNRAVRKLGCTLFGFTAGLGWLWIALGRGLTLGAIPVDLWVPDASYFFSAFLFPHLPLAQGLYLLFLTNAFDYISTGRGHSGTSAALAGLLVSLIHPYTLPVAGVILGLFIGVEVICRRWRLWPAVARLALVTVPSAPYLAYTVVVFWTNPAFRSWREQSQTVSPSPIHYALGMGLILIWAAVGAVYGGRSRVRHIGFLVTWAVAVPVLAYVPSSIQRRFTDGYQAPLTVLGAWGMWNVLTQLQRPRVRRGLLTFCVGSMTLTNVLLVASALALLPGSNEPIFRPTMEQRAADWLVQHAQGQVVLSSYTSGNYLPTRGAVRVFLGHGPETMHSSKKRALAGRFFDLETDDAWRRRLIAEYDVRWVWWGPWERALGDFDPGQATYLRQMYDRGGYVVYGVEGGGGEVDR